MKQEGLKPNSQLTFDTVNADRVRLLADLNAHPGPEVALDLQAVTLCDSAGLALLIEIKRRARALKKTVLIAELPHAVSGLAEFCGVLDLLSNQDNGVIV